MPPELLMRWLIGLTLYILVCVRFFYPTFRFLVDGLDKSRIAYGYSLIIFVHIVPVYTLAWYDYVINNSNQDLYTSFMAGIICYTIYALSVIGL